MSRIATHHRLLRCQVSRGKRIIRSTALVTTAASRPAKELFCLFAEERLLEALLSVVQLLIHLT